jgi:polysaccharide deacetylase 2 family uncharacterized protein YibQ
VKLPKLPKLSGLFRKKDADDESDEDFDEEVEEDVDDAPDSDADDGDDDYDDDDDDSFPSRRPMVIAIAGALVLLAGVAGGAGWWYFSGDDGDAAKPAARKAASSEHKGPMVGLALPPRRTKSSRKGGLNQFSGDKSKGVMTPSAPRKSAFGTTPQTGAKSATPKPGAKPTLARTVGDIGGRFGGRANPLGGSLNAIGGAAQDEGAGIVIPSVTSVTLRKLPDNPGAKPLGATPDARLIEKKKGLTGALPITGKDGATSWQEYARPYDGGDSGKRVAIVIMGLGLSRASSMAAIGKLPPQVSLALDPYALNLSDWLVRARLVGHEVLLTLPMESERFPVQDAGPYALNTALNEEDNIKRLELVLSQVTGYFGVATVMGSRFGTSEALMTPILTNLMERGLMLLTTGSQSSMLGPKIARKIGLPLVVGDVVLDGEPSPAGIKAQLLRLEGILRDKKVAVAIAQPYPATLATLIAWTKTLEAKKIKLVPVSALTNKQNMGKKPN